MSEKLTKLCSVKLNEVWKRILVRPDTPEFPTGLKRLDRLIWGLSRDHITIIAARPKQGKTSMAVQIALALASKVPVIFYTLEMSEDQIVERIIALVEQINNEELRGSLDLDRYNQKIMSMGDYLDSLEFYVSDSRGYRIEEIHEDIHTIKPAFVFLDYIQKMKKDIGKKRHEAIEDDLGYCGRLVKQYRCGIVIMSQLNRSGELKASGALEEGPDLVLELDYAGKKNTDDPNDFNLVVAYNRHGPTGRVKLRYYPEHYRFMDPI